MTVVTKTIHARAGLLGNPSDGYNGKTISCLIKNFAAFVTLSPAEDITLLPGKNLFKSQFTSLDDLNNSLDCYSHIEDKEGLCLLQAACNLFYVECMRRGIKLEKKNFTLDFETTIPLQVGMAGSSAIVIATLRSLMDWYEVEEEFRQEELPQLALDVELKELGITAGQQDRVIQTYGGAFYMDFREDLMNSRGYGDYQPLDQSLLPPLYLAYSKSPSNSGKIHKSVRELWLHGDPVVREAMLTFASFAELGKQALADGDHAFFTHLMGDAFLLRRKIFGDVVLGVDNLRLTAIANSHGLTGATCGSGGAIVGVKGTVEQNVAMQKDLITAGYAYIDIEIGPKYSWKSG
ncbi:MAG: GHMP kinase [bacterium]